MKSISKKHKRKATQDKKRPVPDPGHAGRFDQLLGDAILGVKKKNRRG